MNEKRLLATASILFLVCVPLQPMLMQELVTPLVHGGVYQTFGIDEDKEQWYEVRTELQYHTNRSCAVRVVFRRDVWTDIHFYFYNSDGSQVVLYTKLRSVGYLLDVSTVPDPQNPDQELLLFVTAAQYPVGHLWRVDPERKRIQKLLEGTYLDVAYLVTKRLVTEWKPAHYVLAEGRYDFQLMAKRLWRWDDKGRRFKPSWWWIEEPTYRFFSWIDEITDQFDKLGTPCNPPEPAPAEKMARFDYYTFWLKACLDSSGTLYHVQLACDADEAYLSIYKLLGGGKKLLRCTRLEGVGLVTAVQVVPNPSDPRRSCIVAYEASGRCIVWRINSKTMRPEVVMDGYFLDVSQVRRGVVKEWEQALSLVKDAGWDAYPPAFRDPKAMAYRVWRWDRRKQKFVVASSWRIGKWSRADYKRFGFWE